MLGGMSVTSKGRIKQICNKYGLEYKQWLLNRIRGKKFCYKCKSWRLEDFFNNDKRRYDGKKPTCKFCAK